MLKIQTTEKQEQEAAAYINGLFASYIESPILLMLAGGSARAVLPNIDSELLGENITVTVTDERYIDDLEQNNFSALQGETFYNNLISTGAYCIDTQIFGDETAQEHAQRFGKNIIQWRAEFPDGKIIGLFGVGIDGHIAGIIPNILNKSDFETQCNSPIQSSNGLNIVTSLPAMDFIRTTVTLPFIASIDHALVYMKGQEKSDALAKIVSKEGSLFETPARILNNSKDPVIFTDISVEPAV